MSARSPRPRRRRGPARPPRPGVAAGIPFGRHRPRIDPSAFVTEGTYVVGRVTVGARASVWFGAVLRGDFEPIRVGAESLIEDNVVLHGRVVVGRRCVIGHGAILHGCTVADGAVVGSNAVVFDGARIGAGALVTAGSVVYPKTRVAPHTVFRNSAGGNQPVVAPVGSRTRHWQATSYQRLIATYRSGAASGRPANGDRTAGASTRDPRSARGNGRRGRPGEQPAAGARRASARRPAAPAGRAGKNA